MRNLEGYFFGCFFGLLGGVQPGKLRGQVLEAFDAVVDDAHADFQTPGQVLALGNSGTKAGIKTLQTAFIPEKSIELIVKMLLASGTLMLDKRFLRVKIRGWHGFMEAHGLAINGLHRGQVVQIVHDQAFFEMPQAIDHAAYPMVEFHLELATLGFPPFGQGRFQDGGFIFRLGEFGFPDIGMNRTGR